MIIICYYYIIIFIAIIINFIIAIMLLFLLFVVQVFQNGECLKHYYDLVEHDLPCGPKLSKFYTL